METATINLGLERRSSTADVSGVVRAEVIARRIESLLQPSPVVAGSAVRGFDSGLAETPYTSPEKPQNRFSAHDRARNKAQAEIARTVAQVVALAEAEAIANKKRKKDEEDEFVLWCAALFAATLAVNYHKTAQAMAIEAGVELNASPTRVEEEAYAKGRAEFLKNFPEVVRERIDTVANEARKAGAGDRELHERIRIAGEDILQGVGNGVAETEAQCIYGQAAFRAFRRAGFKSVYWVTMGDERVRHSHTVCEEAGAVEIGKKFPNGLLFPGDSEHGGPEEVCNCRCWLEGASKK